MDSKTAAQLAPNRSYVLPFCEAAAKAFMDSFQFINSFILDIFWKL